MKSILYIARNIPVPGWGENDVILKIADSLRHRYKLRFAFPLELMPPIPFLRNKSAVFSRLPPSFRSRDFEVDVLRYPRLPSHLLSFSLLPYFSQFNRRRLKQLPDFDLCHAHYVLPDGYMAWWFKQEHAVPYVLSVREGDIFKLDRQPQSSRVRRTFMRVLSGADSILVSNNGLVERLSKMGVKACLMPHGIDIDSMLAPVAPSEDAVKIICVSQVIPRKNIDWITRALNEYPGASKLEFCLVGEGPQLEEVTSQMIDRPGLKYRYLGRLPHPETLAWISKADIFALPSVRETFGLVYLEAAANRCAVLGTRGTGMWGHFEDGTEMLFHEPNYEDFRDKFFALIDDPKRRVKMAESGERKVEKHFLWPQLSERYSAIYEEVLSSGHR